MENQYTEETFLARWIAGELSETELAAFEKTEAYRQFTIIDRESQLLSGPYIDTESALAKVSGQLHGKEEKTTRKKLWWLSAAACALVLLGLFTAWNATKTHVTGIGEKTLVVLSDGSKIELNAGSKITHKRFFWDRTDGVTLEGEAYFTIAKGGGFKVCTDEGTVTVLGTQFNINERFGFSLHCYEGRISFLPKGDAPESIIVTKGMALDLADGKPRTTPFSAAAPAWQSDRSIVTDQPLAQVLQTMELHYPIVFETQNVRLDRLYTGTFPHDDLQTALEAILPPMGIRYRISEKEKIVTLSE